MFKDNNEVKNRLLDLELKMESHERELSELKTIMLNLSVMINNMQTQLNNLLDKQQKSLQWQKVKIQAEIIRYHLEKERPVKLKRIVDLKINQRNHIKDKANRIAL